MIRMVQANSAAHAKAYFTSALSQADYYVDGQELNGRIQGKLAERLGIAGPVTKEVFADLCENYHPLTRERLTPRTNQERRVGYDINFHCPKSLSILHGLSQDDHLLKAFEASVQDTMRDVERDAKTRVRKDGQYEDRPTGELIWADFTHQTARPVEDATPDPHLHAHCFVFNATWDDEEQIVKAGQFGDIKRDMPFYQATFHKRLSDRLLDLGYQIKRTDKSFEVVGVPPKVIDLFSKRTDEIGRVAKEKGITDAAELSELGARTRSKKQKGLSMSELKADWKRQILELDPEGKEDGRVRTLHVPGKAIDPDLSKQCVDHSLLHGFERASVLPDRRLLEAAFRHGIGERAVSVESISHAFASDHSIIPVEEKGRILCTTKLVLAEERRMVELARKGQGKMLPLYREAPKIDLKEHQYEAVRHVLTTPHRVSIIRGAAGAGKTTLMQEAAHHIEAAGKRLTVVAPTSSASRGTLRKEGFEQAQTVAAFLTDPKLQEGLDGQVLWVDEAGLLGTRDMRQLLEIATQRNARLILGGDTRQHASVVRGDALRILSTVGKIKAAEVSKIYRQRDEQYRQAVDDLSQGHVRKGFETLDGIGVIKTIDPMQPNKQLVEDYVAAVKKKKSALIVSPTNAQGEAVTSEVRSALRAAGKLGKKEIVASRLQNLQLTEAQKADRRNFQSGQVVQFNQNVKGIRRGSRWEIEKSDANGVLIQGGGKTILLPTDKGSVFEVFQKQEIALSKGDKVRITHNGFDRESRRLDNGTELEVASVSKDGSMTLRQPKSKSTYTLNADFGHIAHAYCVTSHASQGKTVDEVFISQPAATFGATNAKQFYVSVSRGRDACHVYTDDKAELLERAAEVGDRQSAIELLGSEYPPIAMTRQIIREELERMPQPDKAPEPEVPRPYLHPQRGFEPEI